MNPVFIMDELVILLCNEKNYYWSCFKFLKRYFNVADVLLPHKSIEYLCKGPFWFIFSPCLWTRTWRAWRSTFTIKNQLKSSTFQSFSLLIIYLIIFLKLGYNATNVLNLINGRSNIININLPHYLPQWCFNNMNRVRKKLLLTNRITKNYL